MAFCDQHPGGNPERDAPQLERRCDDHGSLHLFADGDAHGGAAADRDATATPATNEVNVDGSFSTRSRRLVLSLESF